MPRNIRVATIQLNGTPAPTEARLERAAQLVAQAAQAGAQLVVLPELFNTGYTYFETNYEVTERLKDQTIQWLCEQAQHHQIYLAGSLMVVDLDDTYNAAFLIAPDGKKWRYDKQYPYLWERVYFRNGHMICVADTALGKIGMLLGWDAAHPDLWDRYAAKVDLLLIMNSQPNLEDATLHLPTGTHIPSRDLNPLVEAIGRESSHYHLAKDLEAQVIWSGIPVAVASTSGTMRSLLPAPFLSTAVITMNSSLLDMNTQPYAEIELLAPFLGHTRIISGKGETLAAVDVKGDAFAIADMPLSDMMPIPDGKQPEFSIPKHVYGAIDVLGAGLLLLNYRRGVRRYWGAKFAPVDGDTKMWFGILIFASIAASVITNLLSRRKK